jgi:hypothetical protein
MNGTMQRFHSGPTDPPREEKPSKSIVVRHSALEPPNELSCGVLGLGPFPLAMAILAVLSDEAAQHLHIVPPERAASVVVPIHVQPPFQRFQLILSDCSPPTLEGREI